ncbi:hypothetical protein QQS21_009699 [Conoideocrella luteorostrata]|uniref:F-box domain-containing protein n=1 Tax=Conoideocrella luteorostrata TaxID=1105319 RepID=A0AAJ0CHD3_9HYPO|nr:hypothetical protein QQS21_009699 [Conoideocrella luteorostrata]
MATSLLQLPNELLAQILGLAISGEELCLQPLPTYTCRRFYLLGMPILYGYLNLRKINCIDSPRIIQLLLRTFHETPSLGHNCRELAVQIVDPWRHVSSPSSQYPDFATLKQLCYALPNVNRLDVHYGFYEELNTQTWNFIQYCLGIMSSLSHIELTAGDEPGPEVAKVMKYLNTPTLRRLTLTGSAGKTEFSDDEIANIQKSNITAIHLVDFRDSAASAIHLVNNWPKALEELILTEVICDPYTHTDVELVKSMLSKQQAFLKVLNLGGTRYYWRGKCLDLSNFKALQRLTLSQWANDTPSGTILQDVISSVFAAPALKTFTWDFSSLSEDTEDWNAFGPLEEQFLQGLVKSVALDRIHIVFEPDAWDKKIDDGYPWDKIDELASKVQKTRITYSKPTISRSDWLAQTFTFLSVYGPELERLQKGTAWVE